MKSKYILWVLAFASFVFLGTTQAQTFSLPANVDFTKVQSTRLEWQNGERGKLGLNLYTGSVLLKKSAQQRAETLKNKWTTTHKRLTGDNYYNYRSIKNRFADQGVGFDDESGTMFTESLWRGTYTCKKADCTDTFIKAIKSTFSFFMSEKRYNWPHYRAMVSKQFTALGLGVAVSGKKYYLVSHYGKNVVATWAKIELAKK